MPSNRIKCILLCFCISVILIRFVKLLDGYAEKLKERKELTDKYVKIMQELMNDITSNTRVRRKISYYNSNLQENHTQRLLFDQLYTLPEEPKEAAGRCLSIFLSLINVSMKNLATTYPSSLISTTTTFTMKTVCIMVLLLR
jgi:hypothetical protein